MAWYVDFMNRQRQSIQQIGALFLLIVAAVLLSIGEGSSKGSRDDGSPDQILFHGIIPVLAASVLSGLASALCQWASQVCRDFFSLFRYQPPRNNLGIMCLLLSDEPFSIYRLRNTHHT